MNSRDLRFASGTLALTLVVPALLLVLAPFGETRERLGVLSGWGVALLIMVPSYLLLVRSVDSTDSHRFLRAFMLGTLLRLVLTVVAVLVFVTQVERAPVRAFVLAFFLGYMLLTGLELVLTVRGNARGNPHGGVNA
jgi:F0F1-type ATP synthase assembly protein I